MNSTRFPPFLLTLALVTPLPATAGLYDGPVDAASLVAAYEGWQRLHDEIYLIGPIHGGATHDGIGPGTGVIIHDSTPADAYFPIFTNIARRTVYSDADFGEPGSTLYLGSEVLHIGASFATFRDVVIGYTTRPSDSVEYADPVVFILEPAAGELPVAPPPPPPPPQPRPAGPVWIDTQGNDFAIHGKVTAYQTLYKQGAGTLSLTHGDNVWLAAPVVNGGVLAASAASLRTDVSLASGATLRFEQISADRFDHGVSGSGTMVKAGQGDLLLSRAQALTGQLHVAEGRLTLSAEATPGERASILVEGGATFDLAARADVTAVATLSGGGDVVLGSGALRILAEAQAGDSFAGRLSGAGALEVDGGARIELTGHNTQAGGTLVRGTLVAGSDASLGATGKALRLDDGQLTLSSAFELDRVLHSTGSSVLDQGEHRFVLGQALSGNGVLTKTGSGDLALTQAGDLVGTVDVRSGSLTLLGQGDSGANSRIVLARDTVFDLEGAAGPRVLAGLSNGDGGAVVKLGANTLRVAHAGSDGFAGRIEGSGAFEKDGAGTLHVGDAAWTGSTRILAGELVVDSSMASQRVHNEGVLRMTPSSSAAAWSGELSGGGRFIKDGSGLLWLRGANSQARVQILQGVLAGRSSTLGRDIEVAKDAGVAFFIDQDDRHDGVIRGAGVLYSYGSGALTLAGRYEHTGGTAISNTLRVDSDARLGAAGAGLLIAGGTLQALADLELRRHIALGADGGTLDSNGFDIILSGRIDGPGGLTKTGDGRLTLLGDYDYAGHTVVAGGELVLAGALKGSFEVLAGARLVASGVLGGDISVSEGGSLWLTGDALEVSGDIDLEGGLNIDLAPHAWRGPLLAAGRLTISQAVEVVLSGLDVAGRAPRVELVRAGDIVFAEGGRLSLSDELTQAGYRIETSGGSIALLAAPVPEPSSIALMLAGLTVVAWGGRRVTRVHA
ncbi:autotransporter-associated beta strand repeat-containing protein [Methyloversatilis thermotolerans]|uniref:autotransporter-associated beta strand repeat-containing protein n=1 Tax=Methyloversatilis thermotolerans TaxID=1346290 RepID=UPI0003676AE6|nr:autotransporter-associated beta strand repeat-containing protein [Methyloversatilis thermotolerans]